MMWVYKPSLLGIKFVHLLNIDPLDCVEKRTLREGMNGYILGLEAWKGSFSELEPFKHCNFLVGE